MRISGRILALSMGLLGGTLVTQDANAWSYYWSKSEVKTGSWKVCMRFASDTARTQHLAKIKQDRLAVSGELNGMSATITCIGTAGPAIAVIMVVADTVNDAAARQLHTDLVKYITGITCFEGCG